MADLTTDDAPGAPLPSEQTAWCVLPTATGRSVRTNSYEDYPDGSRFLAVDDADGTQLAWWPSEAWSTRAGARHVIEQLCRTAGAGAGGYDPDYGAELVVPLERGALRACPHGSYIRVVDADGHTAGGESAYWVEDEWADDPELVAGAVIGAAKPLTAPA